MKISLTIWFDLLVLAGSTLAQDYVRITSYDLMKCSYGERGSLTATCVNATSGYFKNTPYRFDHLDETVRCLNCSLETLESGMFDISGNQIINLDISRSRIASIRQRAFVGLIFLERLNLAHNQIKSIYPGSFAGVKKITDINLENNSISILSEDGFLELVNLKRLNLRNNQIRTISTKAFNGLINLIMLDLSNNMIGEVKEIFNNLTNLQVLNLEINKINNLFGQDFDNLTSLLEIRFAHNSIKAIPAMEFATMPALRLLDLSNNAIDKIISGSFHGLTELEILDISYNHIAEVPRKTLQNLHNLRHLNVSNNHLTTFQTGLYSALPQLRVLNLSHNAIQQIEVTGVFSLHSLHTLDLSNNNISEVDYIALITRLPRIAYLNLEDNMLPCSLEKEMEQYFSEDNFKFILYRNKVGAVVCVDNPTVKHTMQQHYTDETVKQLQNEKSTAIVWLFILIVIIYVIIAALLYFQYCIYKELGMTVFKRTTSSLQLISSEPENRNQNNFLKE